MFALFSNANIYSLSMNILYWTSTFYILRRNRFLSIYFPKHSPTRNILMFPIRIQNRTHFDSLMRFLENTKINNDNEILFVILSFIAVEIKMILTIMKWSVSKIIFAFINGFEWKIYEWIQFLYELNIAILLFWLTSE